MATYLTLDKFISITTMPSEFVEEVENRYPGWVAAQLEVQARWIDSRLRKLYATPFAAHDDSDPTPTQVQLWLAVIVSVEIWLKRGVDLNDAQFDKIDARATIAKEEILEAANSENNWFDLPLKISEDGTAIVHATTQVYSEQSPYVAFDRQAETAFQEDENGGGTFG